MCCYLAVWRASRKSSPHIQCSVRISIRGTSSPHLLKTEFISRVGKRPRQEKCRPLCSTYFIIIIFFTFSVDFYFPSCFHAWLSFLWLVGGKKVSGWSNKKNNEGLWNDFPSCVLPCRKDKKGSFQTYRSFRDLKKIWYKTSTILYWHLLNSTRKEFT